LVPKLLALKAQISSDDDHLNIAPNEGRIQEADKFVSFGKTPASFSLAKSAAENFNKTIEKRFADKEKAPVLEPGTYGFVQEDCVFDENPVYKAEKFMKASKELIELLKHTACTSTNKVHSAHIHLCNNAMIS
jgi:hypothetical protein